MTNPATFTQVRAKCMECGLHFTVHTWYPEEHAGTTLYCPECGQHEQRFMTWVVEVEGYIFQHVPGDGAELDTILGQPIPRGGEMIVHWDNTIDKVDGDEPSDGKENDNDGV